MENYNHENKTFVLLFLILLNHSQLNAQVAELFEFKRKDSSSCIYERQVNESISQFIIYADSTFEFYYGNIGFVHKYTFGKIQYKFNDTFYLKSSLEDFKNRPSLSIYKSQRCNTFRFVNFENIKVVKKRKGVEVFRDQNQDLNSRIIGIQMDSIINCPDR